MDNKNNGTTKTKTEEIQYLGQMLSATTEDDTARIVSISKRLLVLADLDSEPSPEVRASEALFGFIAMLTTREKAITFSGHHATAGEAADLVGEFCKANNLLPVRDDVYPGNLTYPKYDAAKCDAADEVVEHDAATKTMTQQDIDDTLFGFVGWLVGMGGAAMLVRDFCKDFTSKPTTQEEVLTSFIEWLDNFPERHRLSDNLGTIQEAAANVKTFCGMTVTDRRRALRA